MPIWCWRVRMRACAEKICTIRSQYKTKIYRIAACTHQTYQHSWCVRLTSCLAYAHSYQSYIANKYAHTQQTTDEQNEQFLTRPLPLRLCCVLFASIYSFSIQQGFFLSWWKYRIHFFGDYTLSDVTKSKIIHAAEGFDKYSKMANVSSKLTKAVNETKYFILDVNRKSCPICDVLALKK